MLRPGERVSPNVSELSRLMKKLFDGAAQLGHDRIMHDPFSDDVGAPLRREASAPTPCRAPLQVPYRGVTRRSRLRGRLHRARDRHTPSISRPFCSARIRRDPLEARNGLYDLGFGCVADQVDCLLFLVNDGADAVIASADETPYRLQLWYRRPVPDRKD